MVEIKELSDFERLKKEIKYIKMYPGQKGPIKKPEYDIFSDEFVMGKLGKGNIEQGKKRMKQLLKRDCYLLKELERVEIEALIKHGYVTSNSRDEKLQVRDEKGRFEYVVCLLPKNEGVQHVRDKEFIASLNRKISEIEWQVPKSMHRIDVVFNLADKRIGVEVQNSALEYARLEEKIELLEKHFDKWFLIVPKEFVEKYSYLETGKGKVTTMKEALPKLREMLSKKEEILKKAK